MPIRPTQSSNYDRVRNSLNMNFARLIRAQEQVSSGKRILRPSDDPLGTSTSLAVKRQLGDVGRFLASVASSKPLLDTGASALNESSALLTEARELVMQGLSGTLNESDREALGNQLEQLKERLIEIGNTRSGDRYLFGGTVTSSPPFAKVGEHVEYQGNEESIAVQIGLGVEITLNVAGSEIFGKREAEGATYTGLTGVSAGTTADQGSGFATLDVRHDATTGTLGSGVTLANGGASDTLLGTRTLTIDALAGTVRLGNGTTRDIPPPGSTALANFTITDESGAEVHLDFSAYDGTDSTNALSGAGSISLDGTNYVALDFVDTDLELVDDSTGTILHIDTTGIVRSGSELATFSGTSNIFDVLQGMADDLRNVDGLATVDMQERLGSRLGEFDRNHDNVLGALGTLGSRSERLSSAEVRLQEIQVTLRGLVADVEDADLATTALEMSRAEQTLQLAQATGSKLIQNTLLNYLR